MRNRFSLAMLAAVTLAACTENPVDYRTNKVIPVAPSSAVQASLPPRTLAPIEYYRPFKVNAQGGAYGFVSNDAPSSLGQDRPPQIRYWGGALILQQGLAAIYYSPTTIYQNGPKPGTTGAGTTDNSLVGYYLNNLGGSSYWNINTTYSQTVGGTDSFVQNTMRYGSFWAAKSNAARSGATVTDDDMINLIEAGFDKGTLAYDPNTLYMIFTGPGVNLGGGFSRTDLEYCAWHAREEGVWPDVPPEHRRQYAISDIKRHLGTFLYRFFQLSQFKRSAIPNAPKVGSGGSLSPRGDYRAPSDGEAAAWLAQLDLIPETV